MNKILRAQNRLQIARRRFIVSPCLAAAPKKIPKGQQAKIMVDLPEIMSTEVTPENMMGALNSILKELFDDGGVELKLKESKKPAGILIDEVFLKEKLEKDFFKKYFRNRLYLKSINIRRLRHKGKSWSRDHRGKLADFSYQIFIPYTAISPDHRRRIEKILEKAGLLEIDLKDYYKNEKGMKFSKEEIREILSVSTPLHAICTRDLPIDGVMAVMKFLRMTGTEVPRLYLHDPKSELFTPLGELQYNGETLLEEIAPEETKKREAQDFVTDLVFQLDSFGLVWSFLDLATVDIKLRVKSAYKNSQTLTTLVRRHPDKKMRRFMAQYHHMVFPNHLLNRFLNQKDILMNELAEMNRTDPRGSDPVYWEYERASGSIDYRLRRPPLAGKLDMLVNPHANLAAIRGYDEIIKDVISILDEYSDVFDRLWDGELFFMNHDMKDNVPLIKGVVDKIEGGTLDHAVKIMNAVIFQTKLDAIFSADQDATIFHLGRRFIRPRYKVRYLLKYFEYYSIDDVLNEAKLIFDGNEVSTFPEHECFEAGDSVHERMTRVFNFAANLIMNDAKNFPVDKATSYIPSGEVEDQLKVLKTVALPVKRRLHHVDMEVDQYLFFVADLLRNHLEDDPDISLDGLINYIESFLDVMPEAVKRFSDENAFSGVNMINKKHFNSKIGNMFTIANAYPLQALLNSWIEAGGEDAHKERFDSVLALENQYKLSQIPSSLGRNIESHYNEEATAKIWTIIKSLRTEKAESEIRKWKNFGNVDLDLDYLRKVFDPRRKNLKVLHLLQEVGGLSAAEVDFIAQSEILSTRASKLSTPEMLESTFSVSSNDIYSRDFNFWMDRSALPPIPNNSSLPLLIDHLVSTKANKSLRMRRVNSFVSQLPLTDFDKMVESLDSKETIFVLECILSGIKIGCKDKVAIYWAESLVRRFIEVMDADQAIEFIDKAWEELIGTDYEIPMPMKRPSDWPVEIVSAWYKGNVASKIRSFDEKDIFIGESTGHLVMSNLVVKLFEDFFEEYPSLVCYNFESYKQKVDAGSSSKLMTGEMREAVNCSLELIDAKVEAQRTRGREASGRKQIIKDEKDILDDDSLWKMLDEATESQTNDVNNDDDEWDLEDISKDEEKPVSIWDEIKKQSEINDSEENNDLSWDDIDKLFNQSK